MNMIPSIVLIQNESLVNKSGIQQIQFISVNHISINISTNTNDHDRRI